MPTTLKEWAARNTTPEQRARRERQLAAALVRDAQRRAEMARPYTESYARGLAEHERLVAASMERQQQKRRQGCTPDAAVAVRLFAENLRCSPEDITSVDLRNLHTGNQSQQQLLIGQVSNFRNVDLAGGSLVHDQRIERRTEDGDVVVVNDDTIFGSANSVHAHHDTELRCAACASNNVTSGVRAASDENGEYHDDDASWCWDCGSLVELVEVPIPVTDVMDAERERWFELAEVA